MVSAGTVSFLVKRPAEIKKFLQKLAVSEKPFLFHWKWTAETFEFLQKLVVSVETVSFQQIFFYAETNIMGPNSTTKKNSRPESPPLPSLTIKCPKS